MSTCKSNIKQRNKRIRPQDNLLLLLPKRKMTTMMTRKKYPELITPPSLPIYPSVPRPKNFLNIFNDTNLKRSI
jgi:hypothetical protein